MFHAQRLDLKGTVLEIGPGFTDKIALGLAALDFRGQVILIEPCEAACSWAGARYRQLLPRAEVLSLSDPMPDSTALDGHSVDTVVSNHIFDDLLLNAAVPRMTSFQIFSEMQPDRPCSSVFLHSWNDLLTEPTRLERLFIQVVDDLIKYIYSIQPKLAVMNHYLSWHHSQGGLDVIHDYGLRMIRELHRRIKNGRITYNDRIGVEQADTTCWFVR